MMCVQVFFLPAFSHRAQQSVLLECLPTHVHLSAHSAMLPQVVLFIGYIATYSVIWPLTPLMCWVNNHIELRTDLIKINRAWRRVVPRRTNGIGSWEPALGVSICAAVLVVTALASIGTRRAEIFFLFSQNPAHPLHEVFWNQDTPPHIWYSWRFFVLFAWEHVLGVVIFAIYFFLPQYTSRLLDRKHLKAKRHIDEMQHMLRRELTESARPSARGTGWLGTSLTRQPSAGNAERLASTSTPVLRHRRNSRG